MVSETEAAVRIVFVISWMIVHCIFLPLDIYWFLQFWSHRSSLLIHKRKPNMVLVQILSLWLAMFIFQSIQIPSYFGDGTVRRPYIGYIQTCIAAPFLLLSFTITFCRYWLLFYMIKWNGNMTDNQWQSIINPCNECQDWYLQNRQTFGSWKWLRPRVSAIMFCTYLCIVLSYILTQLIGIHNFNAGVWFLYIFCHLIVTIVCVVIPGILYQFIYKNIPMIDDEIGLKRELKMTLWLFYSFVVIEYFAVATYFVMHAYDNLESKGIAKIVFQVLFVFLRFIVSLCDYRHTQWIILHFDVLLVDNKSRSEIFSVVHKKTYYELKDISTSGRNDRNMVGKAEMRKVLQNGAMFDGFMRQLLSEYCSECLLSLIEMQQFKERIVRDKSVQIDEHTNECFMLPKSCPRSQLVHGHGRNDYKTMAFEIYHKYIRIGSLFEINIDYNTRHLYRSLLENEEKWQQNVEYDDAKKLYCLFNPCIERMIQLSSPAFTRFKKTTKYRLLRKYTAADVNASKSGQFIQPLSAYDLLV